MDNIRHLPNPGQKSSNDNENLRVVAQKGYIIAHLTVTDPQRYAQYQDIDEDALARFGGRYLVRGGRKQTLLGQLKDRTVVIEFDSMRTAVDFYESLENQSAKSVRLAYSCADAVVVEGYVEA